MDLRNSGFSLAEMMVVVVIFSFVVGGVYTVMTVGDSSWYLNSVQTELQQELRKAMNAIKDDLRQSGSAAIDDVPADDATYTSITFQKVSGVSGRKIAWNAANTQFALGGTGNTQLLKTDNSVTRVVAQNITTLEFRRLSSAPKIIEVALVAQRTTPKTGQITNALDFKVFMRN
jgi:prepilin-type N-terminal cleavage/methylation domain-containing protein